MLYTTKSKCLKTLTLVVGTVARRPPASVYIAEKHEEAMVMGSNATFNNIYVGTKAIGSPDTYI
jgi:hypothetical protein